MKLRHGKRYLHNSILQNMGLISARSLQFVISSETSENKENSENKEPF